MLHLLIFFRGGVDAFVYNDQQSSPAKANELFPAEILHILKFGVPPGRATVDKDEGPPTQKRARVFIQLAVKDITPMQILPGRSIAGWREIPDIAIGLIRLKILQSSRAAWSGVSL